MSWWQRTTDKFQAALDLILPPACVICRRPGMVFCQECQAKSILVTQPWCQRCGRPSPHSVPECWHCSGMLANLRQVRATFLHVDPLSKVIHAYKYEGQFGLAPTLGDLMTMNWPQWRTAPEIIVPVPLHAARERERGYNQAMLLARRLGKRLSLPIHPTSLKRIIHTRPQVGLNASERRQNVAGAFHADSRGIEGRHVLLVDDVFTTGATLSAAGLALREAGALSVSGFCLAMAAGNQQALS